jgi:hypothetical protein
VERVRGEAVLLAVQDTTTLNFSTHPETEGLGPIGSNRDKTIGLWLHSTLLLREDGQALGLLDGQVYARDPKEFKAGPAGLRNRKPVEEKESMRWLRSVAATVAVAQQLAETVIINIADREGDIYELFLRHAQLRSSQQQGQSTAEGGSAGGRVELLIRCQHDRQLSDEQHRLFEHLAAQPEAGDYCFEVPRQPGKKARAATLKLRYVEVTLRAPANQVKYHHRSEAITLWAIQALEENPPKGEKPICWRLLSTLPVTDAETAGLFVRRYSQRWQIEVFHKILKSGCKAEERQLESTARLERCLALDMINAWHVLALSRAGRSDYRHLPVSQWLAEHEWKALWCCIHRRADPPRTAPSTYDAMRWIAQLGGFLGRKGDGHPGPMTLWRGLQRLNDFTQAYLLLTQVPKDVGNA